MAAMASGCGTKKETSALQTKIETDRRVTNTVIFEDSLTALLKARIDSPEIRIFRPRDSLTVTIRGRKAVFAGGKTERKRLEYVSTDSDLSRESIKTSSGKSRDYPLPCRPLGLLATIATIILIIRLTRK